LKANLNDLGNNGNDGDDDNKHNDNLAQSIQEVDSLLQGFHVNDLPFIFKVSDYIFERTYSDNDGFCKTLVNAAGLLEYYGQELDIISRFIPLTGREGLCSKFPVLSDMMDDVHHIVLITQPSYLLVSSSHRLNHIDLRKIILDRIYAVTKIQRYPSITTTALTHVEFHIPLREVFVETELDLQFKILSYGQKNPITTADSLDSIFDYEKPFQESRGKTYISGTSSKDVIFVKSALQISRNDNINYENFLDSRRTLAGNLMINSRTSKPFEVKLFRQGADIKNQYNIPQPYTCVLTPHEEDEIGKFIHSVTIYSYTKSIFTSLYKSNYSRLFKTRSQVYAFGLQIEKNICRMETALYESRSSFRVEIVFIAGKASKDNLQKLKSFRSWFDKLSWKEMNTFLGVDIVMMKFPIDIFIKNIIGVYNATRKKIFSGTNYLLFH
jgi:hypothetical protein